MLTGRTSLGMGLHSTIDMSVTPIARPNSIISGSVRIHLQGAHTGQHCPPGLSLQLRNTALGPCHAMQKVCCCTVEAQRSHNTSMRNTTCDVP